MGLSFIIITHHWHTSFPLVWKTTSPQNANNTISALFRLLALVLNWSVISRQPPRNIRFIIITSIYLIQISMPSFTILMPHLKVLISPFKKRFGPHLAAVWMWPKCACVLFNTLQLPVLSYWFDHSFVVIFVTRVFEWIVFYPEIIL